MRGPGPAGEVTVHRVDAPAEAGRDRVPAGACADRLVALAPLAVGEQHHVRSGGDDRFGGQLRVRGGGSGGDVARLRERQQLTDERVLPGGVEVGR